MVNTKIKLKQYNFVDQLGVFNVSIVIVYNMCVSYTSMRTLYKYMISDLKNKHLFQYFEFGKREYKGRATLLNYMRICKYNIFIYACVMHKLYILYTFI